MKVKSKQLRERVVMIVLTPAHRLSGSSPGRVRLLRLMLWTLSNQCQNSTHGSRPNVIGMSQQCTNGIGRKGDGHNNKRQLFLRSCKRLALAIGFRLQFETITQTPMFIFCSRRRIKHPHANSPIYLWALQRKERKQWNKETYLPSKVCARQL